MINSSLIKLISGSDTDLVRTLRDKFPDLFTSDSRYKERTEACILKLKNDLARAKKASLPKLPSNFEFLPELIGVLRRDDILLTPSFSLPLQKYLVSPCHAISTRDRLLILPAEFLNPISALGKEHFIIKCGSPSIFYKDYAVYRSRMVAANSRYFSNRFLPPTELRGAGHRQPGALDLFPLPQLDTATSAKLEKYGEQLYQEDWKAILSNRSIPVEKLCNPDSSSPSGVLLQQIDQVIDSLYSLSSPDFNSRKQALLKLYAHKTRLLDGLNLL
ncbi:MAG: hypothetical protein IKS61_03570 [Aeriscardovia sp.]|nr:hypothetical protein [Aeriscardovia sp.]